MDSRNGGGPVTTIGKRQSNLKKSFKLTVRSLLTTCPTQESSKAFPKFSSVEQEHLHQLFIQVITSLHGNIEERQSSSQLDHEQKRREREMINELLSMKEIMRDTKQCPSCKMAISRTEGCNKIVGNNNHLFCWARQMHYCYIVLEAMF